jgi:predicted DNA-binding antitoxin AbrB/MazE fold protein
MREAIGIVEKGAIKLPPSVVLPEGTEVRVAWEEKKDDATRPLERESLSPEDVAADIAWATGKHFGPCS